jgi:hypothetical protein
MCCAGLIEAFLVSAAVFHVPSIILEIILAGVTCSQSYSCNNRNSIIRCRFFARHGVCPTRSGAVRLKDIEHASRRVQYLQANIVIVPAQESSKEVLRFAPSQSLPASHARLCIQLLRTPHLPTHCKGYRYAVWLEPIRKDVVKNVCSHIPVTIVPVCRKAAFKRGTTSGGSRYT